MAKQHKYSSNKGNDEVSKLSEKLSNDLRNHIRTLGHFPLLSESWCEMAEVLGRVSSISDVESTLAAAKDDATLWETEELALRYLLEDGKLNLSLRNLVDYKDFQWKNITNKARNSDITAEQIEKCDKFEKGLGVVLRNAWQHVEAVQTTDVQTLVHYIGDVLQHSAADPAFTIRCIEKGDVHLRQEVMVFHYIVALMRQLPHLQEDRVVPLLRDRNIFMLSAQFLDEHFESLSSATVSKVIEALSLMADSEDFSTYRGEYVPGEADVVLLARLNDNCLKQYQKDAMLKRTMRPLTDCIAQLRRKFK